MHLKQCLVLVTIVFAVCSSGCKQGRKSNAPTFSWEKGADPIASVTPSASADPIVQNVALEPTKLRLKTRNLHQLRQSITACLQAGLTTVTSSMIADGTPATGAKLKFLDGTLYRTGSDILDIESQYLNDPNKYVRLANPSDDLTASFLQALENVANVVAHNCQPDMANCQCGTAEQAQAMVRRCLPGTNPTDKNVVDASEGLAAQCAQGELGMRKGIAAMISSLAFGIIN